MPITNIKFDKIKAKAQVCLAANISAEVNHPSEASMLALLNLHQSWFGGQRQELIAFADLHQAGRYDSIAQIAKGTGDRAYRDLQLIALRAREAGVAIINQWDVRSVARLIDIFPQSVPSNVQNSGITCFVDDTEEGAWIVSFDHSTKRVQPTDKSLSGVTCGFATA